MPVPRKTGVYSCGAEYPGEEHPNVRPPPIVTQGHWEGPKRSGVAGAC